MKNNFVSIIIVHYQVETVLFSCLKSIFADQPTVLFEVIVVDNGSQTGFKQRLSKSFSKVKYLKSPKNLGYGAGNNFGAAQAKGDFLFFLNPDTELLPGCVDSLVAFLQAHKQVSVVAPTLLHPDMQIFKQQGSLTLTPLRAIAAHSIVHSVWPSNPISQSFWLENLAKDRDRIVEVVPGTALMISQHDFVSIGGFDESFFLYFEEYDICRRVLATDKEIWMLANAQIIHVWEASTSGERTAAIYQKSLQKFLIKYYGKNIGQLTFAVTQVSKYQLAFIVLVSLAFIIISLTN